MSLRLTPAQAWELVGPPRPVDTVFPERRSAMERAVCYHCGRDDGYLDFRDELSVREWTISGMCQDCQDAFFDFFDFERG